VTRLSIIIESNDIDALAIVDENGQAPSLTDQQHKKLRLQAMATILICTNLVDPNAPMLDTPYTPEIEMEFISAV
jgi:hypothetical protein